MTCLPTLEINYQEIADFSFQIAKIPDLKFYLTDVTLPDLTLGTLEMASPFQTPIRKAGTSLEFGVLPCTFLVDSHMLYYSALFEWMLDLKEYAERTSNIRTTQEYREYFDTLYSEAHLYITTSRKNNIVKHIVFNGLYPTSLSNMSFSSRRDHTHLVCDATFSYTDYDFGE